MSSSLLQPGEYDPSKERRRRILILIIVVLVILAALGAWKGPEWAARWHADGVVSDFFGSLQHKDFEKAYGIWIGDAQWKQHPEKHQYGFNQFYVDWGPGGEWGVINSYKVDGSVIPPGSSSTVVVQVTVNNRFDKAQIWYDRKDHTLTEMSH
jgi:hypothetical protein